jgi:hypothetical protein
MRAFDLAVNPNIDPAVIHTRAGCDCCRDSAAGP